MFQKKKTNLSHTDVMQEVKNHNLKIDDLFLINFFSYNSIEYRLRFMITENYNFFEIMYIVTDNIDEFWFLCVPYEIKQLSKFCHSFEIEISDITCTELTLIPLKRLQNRNSYEKVFCGGKIFIKAEILGLSVQNST